MLSSMQLGRPSSRSVQRALLLWAACLAGCAASAVPRSAPANGAPDWAAALMLSLQLPAAADECVVALPARLGAARAEVYAPISQAEPWLWRLAPRVMAYAQASWQLRGRRRWLTWLRVSGDATELRAQLTAQAGLDLHWEDAEAVGCDADSCPTLARFLDKDTLRLVRGAPAAQSASNGPPGPCLQLLRDHPSAFEVSFRRGEVLFIEASSDVPRTTQAWTVATSAGLLVERVDQMGDDEAAQRGLERDACRELWGGGDTALDASCERTREKLQLHTTARVRWDDLRLRRDDAARHARAQRYAEALESARPDAALDLADLDDLLRELSVRRTLIETSGADPRPAAIELLQLVARALAQHPAEPRLLAFRADLERIARVTAAGGPAMTAP
jgi:hypothetical protein